MTATPKRNGKARPNLLTAQDALQILYSAVCYVMQAGLRVHAGNVDGKLVLTVTGAQVIYGDGTARFDVTQTAEVTPPSPVAEAERVTSKRVTASGTPEVTSPSPGAVHAERVTSFASPVTSSAPDVASTPADVTSPAPVTTATG